MLALQKNDLIQQIKKKRYDWHYFSYGDGRFSQRIMSKIVETQYA